MMNTQKTKHGIRVLRSIGELFVDKSGGIDRAKKEKTVIVYDRVQIVEQIAFYNGRFVGEKGNLTTRRGEIVEKNGGVVARNVRPQDHHGGFSDLGWWEITIPSGYSVIGERAFYGCGRLRDLVMPGGIPRCGRNAFTGCPRVQVLAA
ncbi:MAG: leucine-rich repeat protein [Thermoguttaceae bacterium]|nr:leucine-rich repeat protein [Thermoguttaceae bacterium]